MEKYSRKFNYNFVYPAQRRASQYQTFIKERTPMQFELGDIIRLKKKHPCGSSEWEVLRVGADFRLKCLGCGHQIMISRKLVEKNVKEIRKNA